MKHASEITAALPHFTGSEEWHRWSPLFHRDLLTDGAKFIADSCDAYWLMDAIASWQHDPKVKAEGFQLWMLVNTDSEAGWDLICEDGDDHEIARQHIEYSDFPLASIKLYAVANEQGGVTIMLPGEY